MTDLDAAPDSLLKFVQCKCKLSSKNPCNTNMCSCRKNRLKCATACADCHGEGCNNSEKIVLETGSTDAGSSFNSLCIVANSPYPNLNTWYRMVMYLYL